MDGLFRAETQPVHAAIDLEPYLDRAGQGTFLQPGNLVRE
jgi:hypothetical protein